MATYTRAKAIISATREVAMQERYQELIEQVSEQVAKRLFEDAQELKQEHARQLDAFVFRLMMQIGLAALEKLLNRFASREIERCRQEGMHVAKQKEVEPRTKLGTAVVQSPYLRNPHNGDTARPMKEIFGIVGQGKTAALERSLSDFGSEDSYAQAEERFEEHYEFSIGRTSILRVTNQVGEDAEEYLDKKLDGELSSPGRQRGEVEEMMVQLDGCDIRTGEYMTARRAGRVGPETDLEPDEQVREQQWREVRVGLVRSAGEVSKHYVARMDDYDEICGQLRALAEFKGLSPDTVVFSPGDGGNGLKEALEDAFPDLQFILDPPHLKEHFYETAEQLGIEQEMREQWVEQFFDQIWKGELEEVFDRLHTLVEKSGSDRVDRLIEHLERFSDCLDYADYRASGWPIGSGEVESAHKYLPQARLKLPGACWNEESINPMLAIRVIKKNGWWDDFWDWRVDNQEDAA